MTVIPSVTTRLQEIFTQALTGQKARVVFGYAEHPEVVGIWETSWKREYRLLGGPMVPQDERFRVEVIVEVQKTSGRDMKPATARCWEIFDLIDTALRTDDEIEDLSFDALFEEGKQEFFQTDKSQGCRIRSTLAGTARI